MCLDEPTSFLDDAYVSKLVELLGKVGAYCRGTQAQLFVVTHDQRLANAADAAFEIGSS